MLPISLTAWIKLSPEDELTVCLLKPPFSYGTLKSNNSNDSKSNLPSKRPDSLPSVRCVPWLAKACANKHAEPFADSLVWKYEDAEFKTTDFCTDDELRCVSRSEILKCLWHTMYAVCHLEKATAPVFCMSIILKYARQVVEKLAFRSLSSLTRLSPFRMDSRDGSRAASGFAEFL